MSERRYESNLIRSKGGCGHIFMDDGEEVICIQRHPCPDHEEEGEHVGWTPCPYCREKVDGDCTLCDGRGEIEVVDMTGAMLTRDFGWFLFRFGKRMAPLALMFLLGYLMGRF